MAQIIEVTCRACGTTEVQLDGALFMGYQPRCEQCGDVRLVSWDDHADAAPPPEPGQGSLEAWAVERAGTCSCGGHFSLEAPIRCGACRSTDVDTTVTGSAD